MVRAKFTEQDFIPESDEAFPIYDGDVQMLDSQVRIVQQELIRRIQKVPLEKASEYSKRELISPLLLGALFLVNGVSMGCEKRVVGHYGRGPIDCVFIFRSVLILLTEAKLNDLDAGFIQNIMQQQSSRDFLTSVLVDAVGPVFAELRKRKFEEISIKLSSFASFGVVTTASSWLFTKVERDPDDGKAVITRSKRVELRLTDPQTPEENKTQQMDIARIIGKLVAIIKLQMKAVDDNALITGGPNIDELVQGIISGAVPVTGEYESDDDDECE